MRSLHLMAAAVLMIVACGDDVPPVPKATVLTRAGVNVRQAGFTLSPDGKRATWWEPATDSSAFWELWEGNADLSSPIKLGVRNSTSDYTIWSPDSKRIATESGEHGIQQVVVVPSGGGQVRTIQTRKGINWPTSWYPDNDRLVYQETANGVFANYVISLSTGKVVQLLPNEKRSFDAYVSPDGKHMAYSTYSGTEGIVFIADSNGNNGKQVAIDGRSILRWLGTPWSPDSKHILVESIRTGRFDLWIASVDGSPPRQLTRDVRNDLSGRWSSDGRFVAFLSDRGKQSDVWVAPVDSGPEVRITDSRVEKIEIPQWRPGTSELLFVTDSASAGLFTLDLATGTEERLTPDSVRVTSFSVSPKGDRIAFVISRAGHVDELSVIPIAGGAYRTLVPGGGTVANPRWSPNGGVIGFNSDRAGLGDVWTTDTLGALKQITDWPGAEADPRWTADGSLYFVSDRNTELGDLWRIPPGGGAPVQVTHNGAAAGLTRPDRNDVILYLFGNQNGQSSVARLGENGQIETIWDKSNAFPGILSPRGDSLFIGAEAPDGRQRGMIVSVRGGAGRVITGDNEGALDWSPDGASLLTAVRANGKPSIGILSLKDGTHRMLTKSEDLEDQGAFTPDGKTVVFIRRTRTVRVNSVNLDKVLPAKP